MTAGIASRVGAAPISWGICEVPGWGYQLAPSTVLQEMHDLGVTAVEFGPEGFLPGDLTERSRLLRRNGLRPIGGFLPLVLHSDEFDPMTQTESYAESCQALNASVVVLAASTGADGYDARPTLDEAGWRTLLTNLDRIDEQMDRRGLVAALHPHVGTMVQTRQEVQKILDGSRIGLCADTGHLLVGGSDPVSLARDYPDRIAHVHLKDVRMALAGRVQRGEIGYAEAVKQGLYAPLGKGDLDVIGLIDALEAHGYNGWYVLEQDVALAQLPEGQGPAEDVRVSLEFLNEAAA